MDFIEWVDFGQEKGWVAPGTCLTHDLVPMHDLEARRFEAGEDPCIPIIRVWIENTL